MISSNENRLHGFLEGLFQLKTPSETVEFAAGRLLELFNFDRVSIKFLSSFGIPISSVRSSNEQLSGYQSIFDIHDNVITFKNRTIKTPIFFSDIERSLIDGEALLELFDRSVKSAALLPVIIKNRIVGIVECHHCLNFHRWRKGEIEAISEIVDLVSYLLFQSSEIGEIVGNERRLKEIVEGSGALIMELNSEGEIEYVSPTVLTYIGSKPSAMIGMQVESAFEKCLTKKSFSSTIECIKNVLSGASSSGNFIAEIIHQSTRNPFRLLFQVRSSPVLSGLKRKVILTAVDIIGQNLSNSDAQSSRNSYQKLVEYGNTLMIKTDANFLPTEILGDSRTVLGVSHEEILKSGTDLWLRSVYPEDLQRLVQRIKRLKIKPMEFSEEFRVINQGTRVIRWLVVRGAPIYSESRELIGWEGFGLDHTEKREAQQQLLLQSRRIEALYEVSGAIQFNLEPSVILSKGFQSLIKATKSDGGVALTYDHSSKKIAVVESEGIPADFAESLDEKSSTQIIKQVMEVIQSRKAISVSSSSEQSGPFSPLSDFEGMNSAILAPVVSDELVLGVICICSKDNNRYGNDDHELLAAACAQIALAAKQAELYAAIKRQASSLAALYRLSHELSQFLTPEEISNHAFSILNEELACKRMWLGVMNEQRTHIAGKAGFGPGIRKPITDVQIELGLRHDFLDQAIKEREPVIVPAGSKAECSGLNRIMQRLNLGTFAIMPLVWLGQVVGVLVIEPQVASGFFSEQKLSLLRSMANEIAAVLLARRFEGKIAESEKMRMAGLFASGVAHNFNNLLQAVTGQASLIQMQLPPESPLIQSSQVIIDAVSKGANLVRQLLNFSSNTTEEQVNFSINSALTDSQELYGTLLGSKIKLELKLDATCPEIKGDSGKFSQVITNILLNAKDAIEQSKDRAGKVLIQTGAVTLRSNEIDPDLPPGRYVRVSIQDNGRGMDLEEQRRCFEPFYTTKNRDISSGVGVAGSGLGLSTAYSIIKQHHGIITVQSTSGDGSTFSIYLPIPVEVGVKLSEPRAQSVAVETNILIYGFDTLERIAVKTNLESLGLSVTVCPSSTFLLDQLSGSNGSNIAVVFDGDNVSADFASVLHEARKLSPLIRIIGTSYSYHKWSRATVSTEGMEYVRKPLNSIALQRIVELVGGASKLVVEKLKQPKDVQRIIVPKKDILDSESNEKH